MKIREVSSSQYVFDKIEALGVVWIPVIVNWFGSILLDGVEAANLISISKNRQDSKHKGN